MIKQDDFRSRWPKTNTFLLENLTELTIIHVFFFYLWKSFEKLIWYDMQLYIAKDDGVDKDETHYITYR